MTPNEHYAEAERLLAKGVEVVNRIGALAEKRDATTVYDQTYDQLTERMDELGQKVMGIWAQAQVHATLANAPLEQIEVVGR
ncbi:hypothetical protein [Mycolicibacterium fortuitum]|uniref:hypothetical protein n=1 Tax=Mycolicibacterium fortuitum TaxID=1766 RepID=UPI001CDC51F3|nr:hypothetical protein [Mycolicibacterium fortuitum]UBV14858.1 hypothetical protein H8Z57_29910 [Mycolicibacterium fortuitum]